MTRKKFRKGSKEARAFMSKLRSMRKTTKRSRKAPKGSRKARSRKVKHQIPSLRALTNKINAIRKQGRKIVKTRKVSSKPFYFTGRRNPQIILNEGEFGMARRKTRRRSRRYHGGFDGRKRRSSRRRSRRGLLMGGIGGGNIPTLLTQGAIGAAGAIGSAFVANMVPQIPAKMKPIIPIALAIALVTFGKKFPMAKPLAFGAAISGVLGFTKQFAPQLPSLAGVETAPELSAEEQYLLGTPSIYGAVNEFSGQAVSPIDL